MSDLWRLGYLTFAGMEWGEGLAFILFSFIPLVQGSPSLSNLYFSHFSGGCFHPILPNAVGCTISTVIYTNYGICVFRKAHVCTPPCLSEISPMLPFKKFIVSVIGDAPLLSFQGRLSGTSSSHTSLLQAIGDAMSLAEAVTRCQRTQFPLCDMFVKQ